MTKGWERASLEINTRPIRVEREISRADLIIPDAGDRFRLVAASLGGGLGLSFLFVFWPLMLVAFVGIGVGRWILPVVLLAALVIAAKLFTLELRERRDVAEELRG